MPHVLVAGRIHDAGLARLRAAQGVTLDVVDAVSTDAYAPLAPRADAILIRTQPLPRSVIDTATRLKIVSRHGVGYDAVDEAALTERGIPLAIVGDVNSRGVAEHAMGLILALAKRTIDYDAHTRRSDWDFRNSLTAMELADKELLIVGFGRIGRHVAAMADAFAMTIVAYDPFVDEATMAGLGVRRAWDLHAALKTADIVTVHMPRTAGGPLIGEGELGSMKPSAMVVNTARGGIIDETALVDALSQGRLAGAGLDVFVDEPPPPDHPLLASGRVVLSPHSATLTPECSERMAVAAAQNILDFFAGRLDPALVVNEPALGSGVGEE